MREVSDIMEGWKKPGPSKLGWHLYEMNGDSRPAFSDVKRAYGSGGLTPDQRLAVNSVMHSKDPMDAFNKHVANAGAAARVADSFGGKFPTLDQMHERMRQIDQATQRPLVEPVEAVRGLHGVNFMDGYKGSADSLVGTYHVESGYSSTSLGSFPTQVDNKDFGTVMNLKIPRGAQGIWMGPNSIYDKQRELILPRNVVYYIKDVYNSGGKTIIDAEVVVR